MKRLALLAVPAVLLAACAGPSVRAKRTIAQLEAAGDFTGAADRILSEKDDYGPANAVLFDLDAAQALADAGRRAEADPYFARAQDQMEKLWTLSVTKLAGSALANENVDDYRGENFERTLSHVLRALNFIALGRRDDALVEAKRVELFLDEVRRTASRARSYEDDAFARWMASMLYADLGRPDDARISGEAEARAFAEYGKLYGTDAPPAPAGTGDAEVVFVHLDGPAPRKVRRDGGGPLGLLLKTSYPAYETVPAKVAASEASAGGAVQRTALVENVAAIAAKDLEERLLAMKVRSTLRAAVKLAGTAVGVESVDSEFADIRGWATMPSRVRVARLRVPSGKGLLHVRYLDARGRELSAKDFPYEASPDRRAWVIDRTAF